MKASIRKFLFSAILVTFVNGSTPRSDYAGTRIVRSGLTVLTADSPQGLAKVMIRTVVFDNKCTCPCLAARALRELGLEQMLIVASGQISIGSKSIIVPDSAFDRLFNPHETSLQFKNGKFVLRFDCGDAANSYFVLIYFNQAGAERRLDYWGEAPEKPVGDMHYFQVGVE